MTENYIYSYLYIAPEQFEAVMGKAPDYQRIIAVSTAQGAREDESRLSDLLLSQDGVNTVRFTSSLSENFDTMIASLDYVIMVIVFSQDCWHSSCFITLRISILQSGSVKSLLSKVLGLLIRRVSSYVFETSILTIIGSLLGLVLGVITASLYDYHC